MKASVLLDKEADRNRLSSYLF